MIRNLLAEFFGSAAAPAPPADPLPLVQQVEDPDQQELTGAELAEIELVEALWDDKAIGRAMMARELGLAADESASIQIKLPDALQALSPEGMHAARRASNREAFERSRVLKAGESLADLREAIREAAKKKALDAPTPPPTHNSMKDPRYVRNGEPGQARRARWAAIEAERLEGAITDAYESAELPPLPCGSLCDCA